MLLKISCDSRVQLQKDVLLRRLGRHFIIGKLMFPSMFANAYVSIYVCFLLVMMCALLLVQEQLTLMVVR